MKLYAGALFAQKITREKTSSAYMATSAIANNEHEAKGLCYEMMFNVFPVSDGWTNHGINVAIVPDHFIESVKV